MATIANTVTTTNMMAILTTPVAGHNPIMISILDYSVINGFVLLGCLMLRKEVGSAHVLVNVLLDMTGSPSCSQASGACIIESLFYFQRFSKLSHVCCKSVYLFLIGTETLDLPCKCWVILHNYCPVYCVNIQSLKKLSQYFAILERVTWIKSNKLSNIVKIMYVILHHLGFRKYSGSCDLDQK